MDAARHTLISRAPEPKSSGLVKAKIDDTAQWINLLVIVMAITGLFQ